MKIKFSRLIVILFFISCGQKQETKSVDDKALNEAAINKTLDSWHAAAAQAKYIDYFKLMTRDGVFIGTDPTENWQLEAFKTFCKPYFDKGKAWNFTSIDRHIYIDKDIAWFDELLNTQMKICRGSGVLKKEKDGWKVAHYVLSMTIPNENTKEVVALKSSFEDKLLDSLSKK